MWFGGMGLVWQGESNGSADLFVRWCVCVCVCVCACLCCRFGEEEAKLLAIAAEKEFSSHYPGTCGIQVLLLLYASSRVLHHNVFCS